MKTVLVLLFAGLCVTPALADNNNINSWIKPTSGYWEEQSSWSLGVPTNSPSIYITNSGWKAVGISATTATNYPSSMSVSDLTIRGAWDTENTLLLQYAGTDVPFTVANGLIAADGGRIVNFDSALVVQGGTIIVTNSEIVQDGGFIRTTNATMYLQNAEYDLTNGVFEGGTVSIGTPAHSYFNQYGGAAMITDLGFGRGGGGYLLYGGTLDLPGGLPLIGRPGGVGYFQSGGTNRTLNVLMEDDYAGSSPNATLNGGLLAAGNVDVHSGWFGQSTLTQNGGTHIVTNALNVAGGASEGAYVKRAAYYLNSGALAAGSIELNANGGDSLFVQTNGSTSAGTFYAHSLGYYGSFNDYITLMGGSLTCSNFTLDDGRGCFTQSGGELVVSNLLTITGYRDLNIRYYGLYAFNGGTVNASNINIAADCIIGDGSANRISNLGTFSLSHLLQISNAVEQLGRFILVTNASINLAGSASQLSFANSSGESWGGGATLTVANWNGNPSGGGAEQLKFGNNQSGLTANQLSQIRFQSSSNLYPAKMLSTGEVVPDTSGTGTNSIINAWIKPTSGYWEEQASWSLGVPTNSQSIYITNQGWKAVGIGTNTAQNFPKSLNVASVILGGYTDSFNTLLLNYAGFETPLTAGSITVGTNSGITALASALSISNYGAGITIFGSFNQGEEAIVNAPSVNLGNYLRVADGPGTYNQTNGTINAGEASLASGSTFNQFDGANTIGTLWMGAANGTSNYGRYNLANGALTAGSIELYRGVFNQTGGSVTADLGLGDANYTLSGGTLRLPGITIPNVPYGSRNPGPNGLGGVATLLQTGGTNFCNGGLTAYNSYGFAGVPVSFFGPGHYVLSNGVLWVSNTVRAWLGSFEQWGGWHTNAGTAVDGGIYPSWEVRSGSFTLGGGTLVTPSISVGLGVFTQSGGTNCVGGGVAVGTAGSPTAFTLSGGLLTDTTTFVDGTNPQRPGPEHANFTQSGGTHIVTNLLRLTGVSFGSYRPPFSTTSYVLSNGVLNAPNIQIDIGAFFEHDGGTLTTSGLLNLGEATWYENTTGQQFGQLLLSAPASSNAVFSLPSGNCVVRFANSSSIAWYNQATFLIQNWHGSVAGGGASQLYFGANASGLTSQQLAQIKFSISGGLYPARILATGEVVPQQLLTSSRSGNTLTLTWGPGWTLQSSTNVAGPFQDVPAATSPYALTMTKPQEFFRVRQ